MINKELEDYAGKRLEQGASREAVAKELSNAGWDDATLLELFGLPKGTVVPEKENIIPPPSVGQTISKENQANIQKIPTSPKIGKFKASRMIVSGSWNLLKHDKEMMLFPIFSILTNLLVTLVFIAFLFFVVLHGNWEELNAVNEKSSSTSEGVWYLVAFCLYLISYFIVTFFEIGIVSIAHGRINGQDLSFQDGLEAAKSRFGKIFVWSLVAATVGMVLRTIAERSKLLGRIIAWILGSLWSILTYFIVPVLFLEDLSIKQSLKRSAQVIKTSWGETAIVNIGVGFVFFLLGMAGFIVLMIPMILIHNITAVIIIGIILLAYFVLLSIISSTLNTIFKVVLYEYATKRTIPQGFTEELFYNAFKTKEAKNI